MSKPVQLKQTDWDILFPVDFFTIGETKLEITPLSLQSISVIAKYLTKIITKINTLNVNLDQLSSESSKIVEIVYLILEDAPEILQELSGLHVDDVKKLPLDTAVSLFALCMDVNLRSQESLVKNFKGLGDKVAKFMSGTNQIQ